MSKIKIKTTINGQVFSGEGIKNKNNIIYKDESATVKINISEVIKISRENDELKLDLILDKNNITKSLYLLKQYNKTIELIIKTKKIELSEKNLKINYEIIDSDDINFSIEFEEI